jgi:hypothetical protein
MLRTHHFCCSIHPAMDTLDPDPVAVINLGVDGVYGGGIGLAVCDTLGLLAVSAFMNILMVWTVPSLGEDEGLVYRCSLGDAAGSPAPMRFMFQDSASSVSGYLAFTGSTAAARYLLVTDAGHDAVHVIDVVHGTHVGYVAAPGTIPGPRGVAARQALVAVSAWKELSSGEHIIQLFEGSGATWTLVRVLGCRFGPGSADGQLDMPMGLRFSGGVSGKDDDDDMTVVVADQWNDRMSMFRVSDGSFVRHVADVKVPVDVEEYENGWLVAGRHDVIGFVTDGGVDCRDEEEVEMALLENGGAVGMKMDYEFGVLSSLGLVSGVGLVACERYRPDGARVLAFATYDALSMAVMSDGRMGWMAAVARSIVLGS